MQPSKKTMLAVSVGAGAVTALGLWLMCRPFGVIPFWLSLAVGGVVCAVSFLMCHVEPAEGIYN